MTMHSWPGRARPYKLVPNLRKYFQTRYGLTGESIVSTLRETPHGPLGSITVFERMPPPANAGGNTPLQRARSVARSLLEKEAGLLDIADAAEIEESELRITAGGKAHITFQRYIGGLLLADMHIQIDIDPDGTIRQFHATLVPVSYALYSAVNRATISKHEVKAIVERDLAKPDQQAAVVIGEPTLGAIWRPPYVRWTATGSRGVGKPPWGYWIDAFSGEILTKSCMAMRQYIQAPAPDGPTPCD